MAAALGDLDIVERLVEAGADMELADKDGRTPLCGAALIGRCVSA